MEHANNCKQSGSPGSPKFSSNHYFKKKKSECALFLCERWFLGFTDLFFSSMRKYLFCSTFLISRVFPLLQFPVLSCMPQPAGSSVWTQPGCSESVLPARVLSQKWTFRNYAQVQTGVHQLCWAFGHSFTQKVQQNCQNYFKCMLFKMYDRDFLPLWCSD